MGPRFGGQDTRTQERSGARCSTKKITMSLKEIKYNVPEYRINGKRLVHYKIQTTTIPYS